MLFSDYLPGTDSSANSDDVEEVVKIPSKKLEPGDTPSILLERAKNLHGQSSPNFEWQFKYSRDLDDIIVNVLENKATIAIVSHPMGEL